MARTSTSPVRATTAEPTAERSDDPLVHEIEGLRYAVDALPRRHGRKSVLTVRLVGEDPGPALVDRCDLFAFRSRRAFAQLVADHFGRDTGQVQGHLALVLDAAERATAAEPKAVVEALTPERRQAAEKLLASPDLLDRVVLAMEGLGHVGEEHVKKICYLIATSRLLVRPLNALLLAPPGTGKSAVLEAVAALLPPEHVVSVVRLTAQSLFYAGPDALRHRVVIVDEYEGQAEADHAVRVLQSRGELSLTTTVKGKAESMTVRGPVAVLSGTTSTSIDPQNASRCVELSLDDSPEQTRRVQEAQARSWAGGRGPRLDLRLWQDAQRLLGEELPAQVVIPFAPKLSFPARTTTDRRNSAKLLGLVAAHALVHARQRSRDREGRVHAVAGDYAAVHALLRPTVEVALDGLSPRAARLYRWLVDQGAARPTRRDAAAGLGWGYNTAKRAFEELLAQELVGVVDRGPPATYRVLDRTLLGGAGLVDPGDV